MATIATLNQLSRDGLDHKLARLTTGEGRELALQLGMLLRKAAGTDK